MSSILIKMFFEKYEIRTIWQTTRQYSMDVAEVLVIFKWRFKKDRVVINSNINYENNKVIKSKQ